MGIINFPYNCNFRLLTSDPEFVHAELPKHVSPQEFQQLVAAAEPSYCTPSRLRQLERDREELLSEIRELQDSKAAAHSTAGDPDAPMKIKQLEGEIADLRSQSAQMYTVCEQAVEAGANFTRIMPPQLPLSLLGHIYTSNVTHMLRIIIPCFQ